MRYALFDLGNLFIGLYAGDTRRRSANECPREKKNEMKRNEHLCSATPTTVFVDWERPEADELRPDAEAMEEEESILSETER